MFKDEHGWAVRSDAGTEVEVGLFVAQLVRALRPKLVVETGCFDGHTSAALLAACASIGGCAFVTCDTDHERVVETYCRLLGGPETPWDVRNCRGIDLPELRKADFIFCDSDYSARVEEMLAAKPDAIIVVHDTNISYNPEIPPLAGWVEAHGGITFPTWRGFGILKVPAEGWQS